MPRGPQDLNDKQTLYVEARGNGLGRKAALLEAGYSVKSAQTFDIENRHPHVGAAVKSLLEKKRGEVAKDFRLSKGKVLEDLELAKEVALEAVEADPVKGISGMNTFTRATELQGRELGMFAQKHHHEHEHSIVPDKELLMSIAKDNPEMARILGEKLGVVIDGEFEEIEED